MIGSARSFPLWTAVAAASLAACTGGSTSHPLKPTPPVQAPPVQAPTTPAPAATPFTYGPAFQAPEAAELDSSLKPVALGSHTINLPSGFAIDTAAGGLSGPRFMAFDPDGNLAIAEMGAGRVRLLRAQGGRVEGPASLIVSGLTRPSSLAFHDGHLYVGEENQVSRYSYAAGRADDRQVIIPDLPRGGQHFTRSILFGPDDTLYLAIGSTCNVCVEGDSRRAAILTYHVDGSGQSIFARGLRNAVGLAIMPGTNQLWATVNGRDSLGNDSPWDLVTPVARGDDFGWPGCYNDRLPDPDVKRPGGCGSVTLPAIGVQAHSAPLGLAFYDGGQFPADYRGDLLYASHGSWNRTVPTGCKLVRVHFADGKIAFVHDFATGWSSGAGRWGRPVQPIVGPDGSVYVSDDDAGAIYRIHHSP